MSIPIFPNGIQGLADSKWSGAKGSCEKIVGIDYRSTPGVFKAHQKLDKHSSETINELCKTAVSCSDGSRLWFSSESGKIWREKDGVYTLVFEMPEGLLVQISPESANVTALTLTDVHAGNAGKKSAQSVEFDSDISVKKVSLVLSQRANPTGTMTVSIQADNSNEPSGAPLVSASLDVSLLTTEFAVYDFEFATSIDLDAETKYWVVFDIDPIPDSSAPGSQKVDVRGAINSIYAGGVWMKQRVDNDAWEEYAGDQMLALFTLETDKTGGNVILSAEEFQAPPVEDEDQDTYIYWTTEKYLHRINIANLDGWPTNNLGIFLPDLLYGVFAHGDTQYHPMAKQGLKLYIGDAQQIASVDEFGDFNAQTALRILKPERIQNLTPFDIDLLIGTTLGNKSRVLRWDTVASSWGAEDTVEEDGINAFIRDDNYVYVQAGSYGRLYFYNGEKLEALKRIPGVWSPTSRARVNPGSVGFHLGIPLFGLSQIEGNPAPFGVYGFGSYSVGYTKTLSLDFPVPEIEFSNIKVGAILVEGMDLYVAWKHTTDFASGRVGIAKLNWLAKYGSPFLETTALVGPAERSDFSVIDKYNADYVDLPDDTDISISIKKRYENDYTELDTVNHQKLKQVSAEKNTVEIANLQVRIRLKTSENNSPIIENVSLN